MLRVTRLSHVFSYARRMSNTNRYYTTGYNPEDKIRVYDMSNSKRIIDRMDKLETDVSNIHSIMDEIKSHNDKCKKELQDNNFRLAIAMEVFYRKEKENEKKYKYFVFGFLVICSSGFYVQHSLDNMESDNRDKANEIARIEKNTNIKIGNINEKINNINEQIDNIYKKIYKLPIINKEIGSNKKIEDNNIDTNKKIEDNNIDTNKKIEDNNIVTNKRIEDIYHDVFFLFTASAASYYIFYYR
jgi:hypothetical protein